MKSKKFKYTLIAITYTILLLFVMLNFGTAWKIISQFFTIITPFIYGFVLAYILNFPYSFLKNKAFKKIGSKHEKLSVIRSLLAIVLTYIFAFGIIGFLLVILIPQLVNSIQNLIDNFNNYANEFQKVETDIINWINGQFGLELKNETLFDEIINQLMNFFKKDDFSSLIKSFASSALPFAYDAAMNVTLNLYNWIIAIIVSVYMLACKERLCLQTRKLTTAYVPDKHLSKVFRITDLSNNMCGKFIVGKIIDSAIIGVICFICLSLFNFNYPLIISVVIGVTNIIPFFGPFIGAIPSAFLLLLIDPVQCLWFILFIFILQQIDGNIIGPKILGNSVGVSGFWIMVSVIIGGGLFGVAGMILGVPVFAVIYTLVSENVNKKLSAISYVDKNEQDINTSDTNLEKQPVNSEERCKEVENKEINKDTKKDKSKY